MSEEFKLNKRLAADCLYIGVTDKITMLLLNNRLVPWFIFVPHTEITEFHLLPDELSINLLKLQNLTAQFILDFFKADKLNIATIGNVVSQLHLHVIGRYKDDFAWPGVVWGHSEKELYTDDEFLKIKGAFLSLF